MKEISFFFWKDYNNKTQVLHCRAFFIVLSFFLLVLRNCYNERTDVSLLSGDAARPDIILSEIHVP